MLKELLLPIIIVTLMLVLLSASFTADDMITSAYNNYVSVLNSNTNITYPVLILDAGHGGADGGAISVTGGKESEINLTITKKAEYLAAFFGIKTAMTRDSETIDYPENCATIHEKKVYDTKSRVELINSANNPVLISIHQNKFDDSSVSGVQVFFGNNEKSSNLADSLTENLKSFVKTVRNPKQISDSIYIFKHISCPAIMIECGFISNSSENSLLNYNEYQNKLAISIISGYLSYENELCGGTNESQNSILLY